MRTVSGIGRIAAIAAVVAAVVLVGFIIFGGGGGYTVKAYFENANQLVKGNQVELDGTPIGSVKGLDITPNGQAVITLGIEGKYAPLPEGVHATIRQASQSGIANRYVDLQMPGANGDKQKIPDGGEISADKTTTSVDLDQLFKTLDPPTRKALQEFFKGEAKAFDGKGQMANVGYQYLNPALSTSRRLFNELNADTPRLEHFVTDSSRLVSTLAARRNDLSALIQNLDTTMGAIGSQKAALSDALLRLPNFMRRSNTTFVNLRAALNDVDPLVNASKPVARKLNPFLDQLQPLLHDLKPTVADLRSIVRRPGAANDLTELTRSFGPLASEALDTKNRSIDFGGGAQDVGQTQGAFPATVQAFKDSAPTIAFGRPYTPDFLGWLDDFSTSGGYDALGGISRTQVIFNATTPENGVPAVIPLPQRGAAYKSNNRVYQYKRCPGAAEAPAADKSNVWSSDQMQAMDCTEADRATGNFK
ncbi:MAG: phospholipid/cholesterol/gamma-HCH transport system substrate-binding protein [Thermoleophilaceae bacterium]|jgi:phospholipid/cholesterol/gamma-HCH transport system substrate-binding protein|nr:phospholipid/cholesterol/gamma-HCH transport system substrate-binding protein [Thermoleophilaceae bacterium]